MCQLYSDRSCAWLTGSLKLKVNGIHNDFETTLQWLEPHGRPILVYFDATNQEQVTIASIKGTKRYWCTFQEEFPLRTLNKVRGMSSTSKRGSSFTLYLDHITWYVTQLSEILRSYINNMSKDGKCTKAYKFLVHTLITNFKLERSSKCWAIDNYCSGTKHIHRRLLCI